MPNGHLKLLMDVVVDCYNYGNVAWCTKETVQHGLQPSLVEHARDVINNESD